MTPADRPTNGLDLCHQRIRELGMPEALLRAFERDYVQLEAGATGFIAEHEIEAVPSIPDADTLGDDYRQAGRAALSQAVMVKLNGGLGTGMGLDRAKSLLPVKDGLNFLDFIARQTLKFGVPLVLMNSFTTASDTRAALASYIQQRPDLFFDFEQHQIPKVRQDDLLPVEWPASPDQEWCPPGHGDFYLALKASGLLEKLQASGRRYLFVSNSDNLGATLDTAILGYVVKQKVPFLMEVADRTQADKKGGHLTSRQGRFVLREKAQCREEDDAAFQDIEKHRYFNTNNLWIDLQALAALLNKHRDVLPLPLIVNRKHVDPCDTKSTPVIQLETAMGAAIGLFEQAGAMRVPRSRFAPVKSTRDLLVIRSDAYEVTEDFSLQLKQGLTEPPIVELGKPYQMLAGFDERFTVVPSLKDCTRLEVQGDVAFAAPVTVKGEVLIRAGQPEKIATPAELISGEYEARGGALSPAQG